MIGLWPSPPPFEAPERAALWLDGSLESITVAYMLSGWGRPWIALIPRGPGAPAAEALAGAFAVTRVPLAVSGPFSGLADWAAAGEAAIAHGARWLATGITEAPGAPPLPLRLFAAEQALRSHGLAGLYAPLVGYVPVEVGRLALALGLPIEAAWHCPCHACEPCRRRAAVFRQLGVPDPLAPKS